MEPAFLAPAYPLRKNFLTHPTKTSFAHAKSIAVRNRRIYDNHSASTVRASADAVPEKLAWVDALDISGIAPGSLSRVVVAGLDVVVACDYDGQVYALGNKGTPLGVPLSGGSIVTSDVSQAFSRRLILLLSANMRTFLTLPRSYFDSCFRM